MNRWSEDAAADYHRSLDLTPERIPHSTLEDTMGDWRCDVTNSHPYRPTSYPAPAAFVAVAELDLACTYALRRPALATECAWTAWGAAIEAQRPDLARRAHALLSAL